MNSRVTKIIDLRAAREGTTGEDPVKGFGTKTMEEKIVRTSSATVVERPKVGVSCEETEKKEVAPVAVKKIRIRECSDLRRWWDEEDQDEDSCECA
jgi:hypothetical protein